MKKSKPKRQPEASTASLHVTVSGTTVAFTYHGDGEAAKYVRFAHDAIHSKLKSQTKVK